MAYFYYTEKCTFICTHAGANYSVDFSLDKLEFVIDPANFIRINRRFIIHIDSIVKMTPLSNSRMKIEIKPTPHEETIVSLHRYSNFKRWLDR